MKDFQEEIVDVQLKEAESIDPYVFVTPEVEQYLSVLNKGINANFILSIQIGNIMLAPLQTIIAALQLSVKEHKNIFLNEQARSKQLAKMNTEMTIHEKRRFELMIRAGGKTVPYTAPVYGSYGEAVRGIYSQGWTAFYKGLSFRIIQSLIHFYPYLSYKMFIGNEDFNQGVAREILKIYCMSLMLDIFSNPILMLENRFMLQNNLKEFRTYRKPIKAMRKAIEHGEATKGLGFHFINNSIGMFTKIPVFLILHGGQTLSNFHYFQYLCGEFFIYPFLTAYRRIMCQTDRQPGMIPTRYSGLIHAVKVIGFEEGGKGLWRGFSLQSVQSILLLKILESKNGKKVKSA